jgi:hypothetical protein
MNKAIRFFKVVFFVAVGLKFIHDIIAINYIPCEEHNILNNGVFNSIHEFYSNKSYSIKLIDYLYGVSNTLFKLAPAYALFILTRKVLGFNRVVIHSAFMLYLADVFDELFFNPYSYGVGEWLTAVVFYFILNHYYKKK